MREVFAILLAAGKSTRMGRCKTKLSWGDNHSLLTYQIQQWLWANIYPVIVLGEHNAKLECDDIKQIKTVINFQAHLGKTTSILAGLAAIPEHYKSVAVSAVDQPRDTKIYQELIHQHHKFEALITAPTYQGKIGHPIFFSRQMHSILMGISEEKMGLRQVIKDYEQLINKVEFSTTDVLIDINTPEEYNTYLI